MSALEQSLDAIIASDKPRAPRAKKVNAARGKAGKAVASSRPKGRAPIAPALNRKRLQAAASKALQRRQPAAPKSVVSASALNYAQKVVVSGLPKDIKTEAVKEFFQSQVGGIQSVTLSYNAKGQPSGNATVIFKQSRFAQEAVTKYNNSPIDNGRSKLRLELVVDPSLKPLSERITPNPVVNQPAQSKKARLQQKVKTRRGGLGNSGTGRERKPANGSSKKANSNNKRPSKKTVEQLDQEMADYFSTNDK